MSNGEFAGKRSVVENAEASAISCRTHDSRRTKRAPVEVDVTVLQTVDKWKLTTVKELKHRKGQALCVKSKSGSVIYLPSVWDENPDWSAQTIVANLIQKARVTQPFRLYTVGTYFISTEASCDSGFFSCTFSDGS